MAASARHNSLLTTWRSRLSWPLGIYTTPVAILIIWQALADGRPAQHHRCPGADA